MHTDDDPAPVSFTPERSRTTRRSTIGALALLALTLMAGAGIILNRSGTSPAPVSTSSGSAIGSGPAVPNRAARGSTPPTALASPQTRPRDNTAAPEPTRWTPTWANMSLEGVEASLINSFKGSGTSATVIARENLDHGVRVQVRLTGTLKADLEATVSRYASDPKECTDSSVTCCPDHSTQCLGWGMAADLLRAELFTLPSGPTRNFVLTDPIGRQIWLRLTPAQQDDTTNDLLHDICEELRR